MSQPCDCCDGMDAITPESTLNRPGLSALRFRVGRHPTFLETMKARLVALPGLTTRESDDASIALLDAWATVADVLTFYQERIANEGYLRTATERRSVLELARLVGYRLRPGVAASVYLAFVMENGAEGVIPQGTRAQSLPGPGETPQPFETSEAISARAVWNAMKPRLSRPQLIQKDVVEAKGYLYFKGTTTGLQVNAPLLIDYGVEGATSTLYRVMEVVTEPEAKRTWVRFERWQGGSTADLETWLNQITPLIGQYPNQFNLTRDTDFTTILQASANDVQGYDQLSREYEELQRRRDILPRMEEQLAVASAALQEVKSKRPAAVGKVRRVERELTTAQQSEAQNQADLRSAQEQLANLTRGELPDEAEVRRLEALINELELRLEESGRTRSELRAKLDAAERELSELDHEIERLTDQETEIQDSLDEFKDSLPTLETRLTELRQKIQLALGGVFERWKIVQTQLELVGFGDRFTFEQWLAYIRRASQPVAQLGAVRSKQGGLISSAFSTIVDLPGQIVPALGRLIGDTLTKIITPPSQQPRSPNDQTLPQKELLRGASDTLVKLVSTYNQIEDRRVYEALARTTSPAVNVARVYTFRVQARLFGYNAPADAANQLDPKDAVENTLWLDTVYDKILPGSPLAIIQPAAVPIIAAVETVSQEARSSYKLSGSSTAIRLANPQDQTIWQVDNFAEIQASTILAQAEALELAEMPVLNALSAGQLELDMVADGLTPGRWVIVTGERTDLGNASGVRGEELAMLANVEHKQDFNLPGDRTVTFLTFDQPLAYRFRQESVAVHANVVRATHGETRTEVLGSGSGQPFQYFMLSQSPLTFLAAPTPEGAISTLEIRVNDLLWHETASLNARSSDERVYTSRTDDDNNTSIVFGNGVNGLRLPTGIENVRARYRTGIGRAGNVGAGRITLLATRPLGAKGVTNPLPASGGADRETADQGRRNTPLLTRSLGRIISVEDYADFARTFAGIGKAHAVRLSTGIQPLVYLTIAGADDIPIEKNSDLYRNLIAALSRYGDPYQPFRVEMRDLLTLVINANVRILPDYEWEVVKPKIRARLLQQFSFERRELGQDVSASEVISIIQAVAGVAWVDLDKLDALSKSQIDEAVKAQGAVDQTLNDFIKLRSRVVAAVPGVGRERPAQMVYLRPDLPETLALNRI